jgi:two-component system, OmpR family, sensor histidine kinase BaeS
MQSTSIVSSDGPQALARAPAALWIASLGLGAAAAWLLYAAVPGINWLVMTLGIVAAVVAVERPESAALRSRRYHALALMPVLGAAEAVTCDPATQFLLFIGIAWLGAVAACLAAGVAPERLGPARLAAAGFVAPVIIARHAGTVLGGGVRTLGTETSVPLLRGALLAALVVAVFVALLGQADPTFGAVRDGFVDLLSNLNGIGRVVFFAIVAFGLLGFLHLDLGRPARAAPLPATDAERTHTEVERLIVLGSVASVFGLFLVLQLSYLFGNPGARVGSGVTLAEAVHRGFVEMSIVVALTVVIIVGLDRRAARGAHQRLVAGITFLVLAECLVLLASAYFRVTAYEAAYGYTDFRLYVRLYVACLAIVTFLLAGELARGLELARLCWRVSLAALAALVVLGYWNFSAWIVRANVDRFTASGRIDVRYLEQTGGDGVPELVRALPRLNPADRAAVVEELRTGRMSRGLTATPAWFEWNLRRSAAQTARQEVLTDGK